MTQRWATFDCYGTLIDWEGGIGGTFARLWPNADRGALLAAYHRIEPEVQRGRAISYRQVLGETLAGVAAEAGLRLADDQREALAESLPSWPPFPEVPAALEALRARGWRLGILSNTDPDLLAASVVSIGVPVDLRVTAAEAGSYKPAHGHWRYFFEQTGGDRWPQQRAPRIRDRRSKRARRRPQCPRTRSGSTTRRRSASSRRPGTTAGTRISRRSCAATPVRRWSWRRVTRSTARWGRPPLWRPWRRPT